MVPQQRAIQGHGVTAVLSRGAADLSDCGVIMEAELGKGERGLRQEEEHRAARRFVLRGQAVQGRRGALERPRQRRTPFG
jgi:hypothetical protein